MIKRLAGVSILAAALWAAGCDNSGGGSSPKADAKGVQFKEKAPPSSPAEGGKAVQQPGPGAKAE